MLCVSRELELAFNLASVDSVRFRLRRTDVAVAVCFRFPELLWRGEPCRVPKSRFWTRDMAERVNVIRPGGPRCRPVRDSNPEGLGNSSETKSTQ